MEKVLFGERLKNAREASGMSREAMANRIGVKPATVEKWETGRMDPRANRLQTLASLLNVPLMWLLAGNQQLPDVSGGHSRHEILLQKIGELDTTINRLKTELNELKVLATTAE